MQITLIYNPTSGDEAHDSGSLVALLEAAGHEVRHHSVKEDGWKRLLAEPAELVVVAGGDGTVRKVFKELAPSHVAVSVLPLGSANNIARTLGVARQRIDRLVAALDSGKRRRFLLGQAAALWGNASFVESLGGGVLADVLERAEHVDADGEEKVQLGLRLLHDVLQTACALEWELDVDGVDASGAFLAVEIMNVRETGPNVPLAPAADPGDGNLHVVQIRPEDRTPLLEYLLRRLRDEPPDAPPLPAVRGRRITMRPPANRPLRVDDQLWPVDSATHGCDPLIVTTGTLTLDVVLPPTLDTR